MAHTVYNGSALQRQPSENVPPPGAVITQGDEVSEAVITVLEVVTAKPDFVKLKDASNKTWNCNEKKFLVNAHDGNPVFHPGRKLEVFYSEYQPDGQKFASRYINDARPSDKPNTWPDKEPYKPGSSPRTGSGFKKNSEFRTPEQIMRTSAIECAVAYASKDNSLDDIILYAKAFYAWILGDFEAKVEEVQEAFGATVEDGIPFDQGSPF